MSAALPRQTRRKIMDAICTAYETTEYALAAPERKTAGTARARAALYALARATTGASHLAISRWIGCNHVSVLHAVERHEQRMAVAEGKRAPIRMWWTKKQNQAMPADLRDTRLCAEYAARYKLAETMATACE